MSLPNDQPDSIEDLARQLSHYIDQLLDDNLSLRASSRLWRHMYERRLAADGSPRDESVAD
jgi:hypothetical protein